MLIACYENLKLGADHLQTHDAVLAPVIARYGLATITPHQDYYRELVESIVGQQLSVKAARAIRQKFVDLFDASFPTPEQILRKTPEKLRSAGLSWAKVKYIQDLAHHMLEDKIQFDHFDSMTNEAITKELTDVKGIGEWTAHMFLMFCMGRLDVLPVGDLGIKNGIRALYKLKDIPTAEQITLIAKKNYWHPYESIASWYVWASLDNKPL